MAGTVLFRTSYSNGTSTPKKWAEVYKKNSLSIGSACEYSSLASTISAYENFTSAGIKYFPSVEYTFKEEMNKKFSSDSLVFIAKTKAEYQSLIAFNNELHRHHFFRVPTATIEALEWMKEQERSEVFDTLIPFSSANISKLISYAKVDLAESVAAVERVCRSISKSAPGNTYLLFDLPFTHHLVWDTSTALKILSQINISNAGLAGIVVSPIAFFEKESRELAYLSRKFMRRPEFPKDSMVVEPPLLWHGLMNLCDEPYSDRVKEILSESNDYFESINFEYRLNDYIMPRPDNMSDEEQEAAFDKLILDGWNKYAKLWKKQASTNEQMVLHYRGVWGDDNVECSSVEEIFALNTKRSERLKTEYNVIKGMGFIGYFLIVADITNYADAKKLPRNPAGRGSAAGCLISFIMGITGVDPIDSPFYDDLLFERFLNPSRVSMPDIDLDFSSESRDKIIKYLKKKYGNNRIVVIGAYKKQKLKPVMKDYHRAMDDRIPISTRGGFYLVSPDSSKYSLFDLNKITKSIGSVKQEGKNFDEIIADSREESIEFNEFYEKHEEWFVEVVKPLTENLRGDRSNHPSGYLILPADVDDCVPIRFKDNKNTSEMISHYEMEECEKAGFIKVDCLNLNAISMISKSAELIKKRTGDIIPSMNNVTLNDPGVIAEIKKDPAGIFQFKSEIQKNYQQQLDPQHFRDLYNSVAVLRTGPMQADAHTIYAQLRHNEVQPEYEHPSMIACLASTGGLIIYQEQVMRLAQDMAGFSLAEADNLRKAIGKKKPEVLEKYRQTFVDGCGKNGIAEEIAQSVWDKINHFAGYGFNMCVTGDTLIHYDPTKEDTINNNADGIVNVPVKWAHDAFHLNYYEKEIAKTIPSNQNLDSYKLTLLKKAIADPEGDYDSFEELTSQASVVKTVVGPLTSQPTWTRLKSIMQNRNYGTIYSYDPQINKSIKNGIVEIKKLESKSPILRIYTSKNPSGIRVSPMHRFSVVMHNGETKDLPACTLTPGAQLICLDQYGESYERDLYDDPHAVYEPEDFLGEFKIPHYKNCYVDKIVGIDIEPSPDNIYEVMMESPYHRYFSNGILSHNSHAVSYSILGYYMGWIKFYYPNEYWCGCLTYASTSEEMSNNIYELKNHIESIGVIIEYPNYQNLRIEYEPVIRKDGKVSISWPIQNLVGVGDKVCKEIYKRSTKGSYDSWEEFIDINLDILDLRVFKALLHSGFFDDPLMTEIDVVTIAKNRKEVVDYYWTKSGRKGKPAERQREEIYNTFRKKSRIFYHMYKTLKVFKYTSKKFFPYEQGKLTNPIEYSRLPMQSYACVGGIVRRYKAHYDKNKGKMCFLTIEDKGETYNVVVFSSLYEKFIADEGSELAEGDVIQLVGVKNQNQYGESLVVGLDNTDMKMVFKKGEWDDDE